MFDLKQERMENQQYIVKAQNVINQSKKIVAFTGAGISVESGIPPFRGDNGIWNKYDPKSLDLDFFYQNPKDSWRVIKEIFYTHFNEARPNPAHHFLADLEKAGRLKAVITQNIDNLHQLAGSVNVLEFHGNSQMKVCTNCGFREKVTEDHLTEIPVMCGQCGALTKPDFVFFGEGIPEDAYNNSIQAARSCDLMIIIGALGEVMPAAMMPFEAKRNGAFIIEVNPRPSNFTDQITDLFIPSKAGDFFALLQET